MAGHGDVTSCALLDETPSVKDLCELMNVPNWHQLAIYLDMNSETLAEIEADNVCFPNLERKRTRMFEEWLKTAGHGHGTVTHRKAIEALAKIDHHKAKIYEDTIVQRGSDFKAQGDSEVQPAQTVASLIMPKIIKITTKVLNTPELNVVASQLQSKYCELLVFIQCSCQNARVGAMKNVLISTLSLELAEQQQWPMIAQYQQEIKNLQTVDDIFMFLTEKHFIGCLNYRLLQVFSIEAFCESKSSEAVKKLSMYQKLFEKLIEIPQFCQVIELLDECPGIHPKPVIGLPIILVKLNEAWKVKNKKDLDQWVPILQEVKLLLQSLGYECILITYAIFPKDVPDVVKFMEDKDYLKKLKENGITLEVSTEAYEIANYLSICTTSLQYHQVNKMEVEKQLGYRELDIYTPSVKELLDFYPSCVVSSSSSTYMEDQLEKKFLADTSTLCTVQKPSERYLTASQLHQCSSQLEEISVTINSLSFRLGTLEGEQTNKTTERIKKEFYEKICTNNAIQNKHMDALCERMDSLEMNLQDTQDSQLNTIVEMEKLMEDKLSATKRVFEEKVARYKQEQNREITEKLCSTRSVAKLIIQKETTTKHLQKPYMPDTPHTVKSSVLYKSLITLPTSGERQLRHESKRSTTQHTSDHETHSLSLFHKGGSHKIKKQDSSIKSTLPSASDYAQDLLLGLMNILKSLKGVTKAT